MYLHRRQRQSAHGAVLLVINLEITHHKDTKTRRYTKFPFKKKEMNGQREVKPLKSMKMFLPLSEKEELIAKAIVDSAYKVHQRLGPGLLESVYEACFCHELEKHDLEISRQVIIPILYDDIAFEEGFRLDVLVDDLVVCELKAVNDLQPIHTAQLMTYLKLTGKRLGLLINFNVPLIKNGIKRVIL